MKSIQYCQRRCENFTNRKVTSYINHEIPYLAGYVLCIINLLCVLHIFTKLILIMGLWVIYSLLFMTVLIKFLRL